ncbi:MAG: hypothetical protein JXB36_20755 [Gammaproteobacteria bacterium]|nr:hypothetical protein [Gammaproteobacteria bacterium]
MQTAAAAVAAPTSVPSLPWRAQLRTGRCRHERAPPLSPPVVALDQCDVIAVAAATAERTTTLLGRSD